MKKGFLFLILFSLLSLVSGCGKTVDVNKDTLPPEKLIQPDKSAFAAVPKITVATHHGITLANYREEELSEPQAVIGNVLQLAGNGFSFDLVFETEMDKDSVLKGVRLEGYQGSNAEIATFDGKIFHCNYPDPEWDKPYIFYVEKEIKDAQGRTLLEETRLEVTITKDTFANFTLFGEDGTYENLRTSIANAALASGLALTDAPKVVVAQFSKEVNSKSVENSIAKGFEGRKVNYRLEWLDQQKLRMELNGFENSEKPYKISLDDAVDTNGFKIYGNLYFTTGKPCEIGYVEVASKNHSVVNKFRDMRYEIWHSPYVGDYVIVDYPAPKVFDLKSKQFGDEFARMDYVMFGRNLGMKAVWFNQDSVLFYDHEQGKIRRHTFKDKRVQDLFKLPGASQNSEKPIEMVLSPDRQKLALVDIAGGGVESKFDISVFSLSGKLLFQSEKFPIPRMVQNLVAFNLAWLDDRNLVLENERQDIVRIDIQTGKKQLLVSNAIEPVVDPLSGNLMVTRTKERDDRGYYEDRTYLVIKDGVETEIGRGSANEFTNAYFLDKDKLVFNRKGDIVLFDLSSKNEEILGQGEIFGVSEDRTRVYYLTNYQKLLYFD